MVRSRKISGKAVDAVERLYKLGVVAKGLQIKFRVKEPASKKEYLARNILSSEFPTLIICELIIRSPQNINVIGSKSASSKEEAFIFAIDDLEDELRSKIAEFCYKEDENEVEENRIINVYLKAIVMTNGLPLPSPFAFADITRKGPDSTIKLYLYRIVIGEESLPLFRKQLTAEAPQVGILFGVDIECMGSDSIEIKYPLQYVANQIGKVTLTNRTVINLTSESQQQQIDDLIKLNTILDDNANYGKSKKFKKEGPKIFNSHDKIVERAKELMKSSFGTRTYMTTPIVTRESSSKNDKIGIDWPLINKILNNEFTSYDQWVKLHRKGDEKRAFTKAFAFQSTSADCYIIDEAELEESFTAKSPFPEDGYETFEEYYLKRHQMRLETPGLPLIPCSKFESIQRELNNTKKKMHYIVPDLVTVFPLPWDLVMVNKLLRIFAIVMERNIELRILSKKILNLSSIRNGSKANMDNVDVFPFLHCLEEATSTSSCMAYERLEHLGDPVLGYFVAMNYFALNSSLRWDDDYLNYTVKNSRLIKSGLGIGIDCIIYMRKPICSWQTCFKGDMNSRRTMNNPEPLLYNQIADIVESLIGAIFITQATVHSYDVNSCTRCERIIIGFLEQLELPITYEHCLDDNEFWFKPAHACLSAGFDFEEHSQWSQQMMKAQHILNSNDGLDGFKLQEGLERLEKSLEGLGAIQVFNTNTDTTREISICSTLFSCALFDDSMDDLEDDPELCPSILLARIRENLFFIGDAALHLVLATECYQRQPDASVGDLHLLRHCCVGDEVLAYLAIKYRFEACLYDQEDPMHQMFQSYVSIADQKGRDCWAKNDGWILGKDEFARRWGLTWQSGSRHAISNNQNSSISLSKTKAPQYPGIGGGLLFGSKVALGKKYTENLAFAFKSIIGAMVLSKGLQKMWKIMLPMFEELLILSADEVRNSFKNNITNQPGKTTRSVQTVRNHRECYGLGWSAIQ